MKKALVAALAFVLVGFMLVNGTLADVFNQARDIFVNLGGSLGAPTTDSNFDVDLVNVGEVEQLYPGGKATHKVQVVNNGKRGACFRLAFAVQDTSAWEQLHFTFSEDENFIQSNWMAITVGTTPYNMKVFTYKGTLDAGEASPTVSITIAMDKDVTTKQIEEFRSDFLKTQVLAIDSTAFLTAPEGQTAPYLSAPDALDAALPLTNFNPFN